jgi:hypothetical protein
MEGEMGSRDELDLDELSELSELAAEASASPEERLYRLARGQRLFFPLFFSGLLLGMLGGGRSLTQRRCYSW